MATPISDPTKKIKFTPTPEDAERLRFLMTRRGARGATLLREALIEFERVERRRAAAEKAAETRAVNA